MRKSHGKLLAFFILAGLLLAALFGQGCATGQKSYSLAPFWGPATAKAASAGQPESEKSKKRKQSDSPARTAGTAEKPIAPAGPSAVHLLLASAGRDASQPQPEAGFALQVPSRIWAGEPFLISFAAAGLRSLEVQWNGKRLAISPERDGGACQALLAVSLAEKSASLPLSLSTRWADGRVERFTADLPVGKRKYPVQRLKVAPKYVNPPPEVQERINRDRAQLGAAISKISPVRYWSLPMLRPVPGEVTSRYGLRRVFNGQARNPHKGVDFDGKEGDPVAALDRGVVVLAANHYYSGNIVVVDHGLGVFSIYLHLSGFNVTEGQRIERGQTVGFIGSTGRVTGPHLHLSFAVLGDMVNGATCMDM